ncbi:MAG: hypothetical protein HY909_09900 [Deltaproteobacteria bacterium]|nr:hypothetical protein [Deltaproteobacteria bacterium]
MERSFLPFFLETAPAMLAALALEALRATGSVAPEGRPWDVPGALAQLWRGARCALGRALSPDERLAELDQRLRAGAPVAAVTSAALVSAGPDLAALLLSLRLLGGPVTVALLTGTWVVAALASWVGGAMAATEPLRLSRRAPRERLRLPRAVRGCDAARTTALERMLHAAEVLGPSYLGGLVVASALEALLDPSAVAVLQGPRWALPASLVGLLLLVDLRAAIPVVAVLVHKGLGPPAALALLTAGGGTSLGLARSLARRRGERTGGAVLLATLAGASAVGVVADRALLGHSLPEVHGVLGHQHLTAEWIAVVALGALLVLGVLRAGPRTWLAPARSLD